MSVLGVPMRVDTSVAVDACFWERVETGEWEPQTFRVLHDAVRAGSRVWDVGAWIGPITLFAAARGAHVVAFEPDAAAVVRLEKNLTLNPSMAGRVDVREVAVARATGSATMTTDLLGDSTASLVRLARKASAIVPTVAASDLVASDDFLEVDVLKIDIEGAEYEVVPRMSRGFRRHLPVLLLSVHVYPFVERFGLPHWLHRLAKLLAFCWTGPGKVRLLIALRGYGAGLRVWRRDGWRPLRGLTLISFLIRVQEEEVLGVSAD